MVVMMLEKVSPSLRGELTRWLLELRPGVFVGTVSALVREKLWEMACGKIREGGGILVYNTDNEQGFAMRLWGAPNRSLVDFEGLSLVLVPPKRT